MNFRCSRSRRPLLIATSGLTWAVAIAFTAGRAPASAAMARPAATAPSAAAQTSAAQASGFVGDDTCTACHESEGKSLRATLHGKAQNVRAPAAKVNQACETCHGPGREHAETGDRTKIRRFTALAPRDPSATHPSN